MKRIWKFYLLLFLTIVLLTVRTSVSFAADKSYTISSVNISGALSKNGSADINETRVYNFSGDYSFAYIQINKFPKYEGRTDGYNLVNLQVCDEIVCYSQITPSQGEVLTLDERQGKFANTFYVDPRQDSYYIKWFLMVTMSLKHLFLNMKCKTL